MEQSFDFIVVGAGAAGCVVAARLSENPAHRVALIEAGGNDSNPLLWLPGAGFMAGSIAKYNWNFETDPIPALHDRKLIWLQGKVLGGSSSINGMIYTHGHSREYDIWRQMGCVGWGFDDLLPYFKKSEGNARGADEWHGGDGPLKIKRSNPRLPIADAFLAAAREDGFPIVDDLNRDIVDGFGYYDVNIDRGRRISTAVAYIHPARSRPNLKVLTNTLARRVIFEGRRATGVEIENNAGTTTLRAKREVILSGGAVKSPHLLLLSGVGPADQLAKFGIPVVVNSANVGRNLQNHPCYRPQFVCSAPVTARRYLRPANAVRAAIDYAIHREGALAESFVTAGGFFRTDPRLDTPDVQVVLIAALLPKGLQSPTLRQMLPREEGFSLTIYQGSPYSRGEIRLRSADPRQQPQIISGYFSDPRDMDVLIKAVERMRRTMSMPGIGRFISYEFKPGRDVITRAQLEEEIRQNAATSYHQSGTCSMGGNPDSVVDSELRVRGVGGLRVADTSIMPRLPNAALHGPTIMIGEKAAAMIAGAN